MTTLETPRERRVRIMTERGYFDLTPEQRAERIQEMFDALKQLFAFSRDFTVDESKMYREAISSVSTPSGRRRFDV